MLFWILQCNDHWDSFSGNFNIYLVNAINIKSYSFIILFQSSRCEDNWNLNLFNFVYFAFYWGKYHSTGCKLYIKVRLLFKLRFYSDCAVIPISHFKNSCFAHWLIHHKARSKVILSEWEFYSGVSSLSKQEKVIFWSWYNFKLAFIALQFMFLKWKINYLKFLGFSFLYSSSFRMNINIHIWLSFPHVIKIKLSLILNQNCFNLFFINKEFSKI